MKNIALIFGLILTTFCLSAQSSEEINFNEYGGDLSYGFAIGGGGLAGIPVRYNLDKVAFEGGLFYRPVLLLNEYTEEVDAKNSLMISGGVHYQMGQKVKNYKNKWSKQSAFLKYGQSFGTFSERMVAVGMTWEAFKFNRTKQSFIFDLGVGFLSNNWKEGPETWDYEKQSKTPLIYWKVHWNWYKK